jgi:hypothetical protein
VEVPVWRSWSSGLLVKSDESLPPGTARRELADEILALPAR